MNKTKTVSQHSPVWRSLCHTVPAHITDFDQLDKVFVIENRTAYIECDANGIPPPAIMWMKDRLPIDDLDVFKTKMRLLNNGRQLEIRNVKVDDGGRYTCVATNKAGQQEKTSKLKVQGKAPSAE